MNTQQHWERIFGSKSPEETSWYEPHLRTSLAWIDDASTHKSASIIDIGGGVSTLVDDLYDEGYRSVTVLDISATAIRQSQERLGPVARSVNWIVGDVLTASLPEHAYDVWHDRAVFHFLTQPEQRSLYLKKLVASLKLSGLVVIATFGPNGPQTCSGLSTCRYDACSLQREMGSAFQLIQSTVITHRTPRGGTQEFLYGQFQRI
jgi:2-polyprenyl-3-methyl-5-hydroxy-6-metoxy-1,4-benzoquinol methylase